MTMFQISQLAKKNSQEAETAILKFVREQFPDLGAIKITINFSKVSLNSVNGTIETLAKKYFFKFHAEENEEKNLVSNEYYNAEVLAKAGFPIVLPLYQTTKPGLQFVIYPFLGYPTAFEKFEEQDEQGRDDVLMNAEREYLTTVNNIFGKTLKMYDTADIGNANLNQLFYNRLVSTDGAPARLDLYYTGKLEALADIKWIINGVQYKQTLNEIIAVAKDLLNPRKEKQIACVVGHGDDHNGNKWFIDGKFVLFDPAFAGIQPALLSFVKATFHNTLAHPFWLYDPKRLEDKLKLSSEIKNNTITITHNWKTEDRAPLRMEVLRMAEGIVWKPLIKKMKDNNQLPPYWQDYIRKALFCSPFLALNLTNPQRYSPDQSLLALSKCIELGSTI